jgi:outer membrane cobalamin receptor
VVGAPARTNREHTRAPGARLALAVVLFGALRSARADDRAETDVLVRGGHAGGFVSRSSIDDSAREVTDAASLVAATPGVHVRRLGADDSFATLSIRGTSSAQVAVFLAGVPLTGGADPTLDVATLPLWPGASARVYRSFAPAALGRGSLGGTLVLDPPSPRAPPRTEVWAAVGSFGSRRLRAGDVRGDPDGLRVATGISASRSDDDFTYLDPLASTDHDVFATRRNAGHAAASGLASIALPVDLGARDGALTITTLAQARRQELPGTVKAPTPFARLDSTRLVSGLELTFPAGAGALGARLWGRREGLAIRDAPSSAQLTTGPTSTDDAIVAAGGSFGWRGRPTEATTIEARVDGGGERFAPGAWIGAAQPPGATRSSAGAAFDGELRASRSLTFSTSARADAWVDGGDDAGASTTEARPTANAGVEVASGAFAIASHGGVLARPPSFVERYGNRGAFLGDRTLRPESAATVDLGGRFDRRFGALALHLEIAGFATWADDLITFVPTGAYGKAKATNIGRARLLGLESEARALFFGFDVRVTHTALATANEGECRVAAGACERPPLPGRPEHDVTADVVYTIGPVRLRAGVDVVTGMRADLTGETVVPDRVLVSTAAAFAVPGARGLSLGLDVRNLFDLRVAEYEGALGPVRAPIGDSYEYPLPGRSFLASARFTTAGEKSASASRRPR